MTKMRNLTSQPLKDKVIPFDFFCILRLLN